MTPFVYSQPACRVVFGAGSLRHLARETDLLGMKRVLVLSTNGRRRLAEDAAARLGARCVGVFDRVVMHVPIETVRDARELARSLAADCLIAVGGGSTTGLAKAIALESASALPIVAIPTTYAGSEVTPIHGITEGGLKKTGRDPRVQPRIAIYDPELTLGLPPALSVASGMNAMAHALEGLYAQDANPVTSLLAEQGMRALAQGLPRVVAAPRDIGARSLCQYGAWLCGSVLGSVGMALHHKLCHTLGGGWNLPHAQTHTVLLPQVAAYNAAAAPDSMTRAARALDLSTGSSVAQGLYDLAHRLGAARSLRELGMHEGELDRAANLATQSPYYNPRPIDRHSLRALLDDAFHGRRPAGAD